MKTEWIVKIAELKDMDRWFNFVKYVIHDFYDIDLVNDQQHRNIIEKNIMRKTAIYVEEENKIIGGMIYSPNQNHIGWLAVDPQYRRRGIGTALVKYMFTELPDRNVFKVKTFVESEWQSEASHNFYKSLGFEPKEICYDEMERNAGHPMLIFIKDNIKKI